jgi:hypothetical protein
MRATLTRRTKLTLALALAGAAVAVSTAAYADTPVTVTISGVVGGRTMAVTTPPVLASAAGGSATGTMVVAVTETNATGVSPWSVTAKMSSDLSNGPDTIASSAMSAGTGTITQTTGLLTGQSTGSTSGSLDKAGAGQTLLQVNGESTSAAYTNVFTATTPLSLQVPSGVSTGTYTGTMTLTLNQ